MSTTASTTASSSTEGGNAIAAIDRSLIGREQVMATFKALFPLQIGRREEIESIPCVEMQYGPTERHALDLFTPADQGGAETKKAPLVLFVHGGGLNMGDKRLETAQGMVYKNIGEFFVKRGYACATINYRLQPAHSSVFPNGGEDVYLALRHLASPSAAAHTAGIDLQRIYLFGSSAGSIHIATYLYCPAPSRCWPAAPNTAKAAEEQGWRVAGFICANIPASFERSEEARAPVMRAYFGEGWKEWRVKDMRRSSEDATPTLVLTSEWDLADEVIEPTNELLRDWQSHFTDHATVPLPQSDTIEGHNHFSMPAALGLGSPYDDWTPMLFRWIEEHP